MSYILQLQILQNYYFLNLLCRINPLLFKSTGIWKKLNNIFKNWRRPNRNKKLGSSTQDGDDALHSYHLRQPVSKTTLIEPSSSEKSAYEQHLKYLQKRYNTCEYSSTTITTIMEETAALRRKWIIEECPPIKEVSDKFPCLKKPKMVITV